MNTWDVDQTKLNTFFTGVVGDLSAGYGGVMVSLGSRLGLREVFRKAGFSHFRRATEMPFNPDIRSAPLID